MNRKNPLEELAQRSRVPLEALQIPRADRLWESKSQLDNRMVEFVKKVSERDQRSGNIGLGGLWQK